MLEFAKRSIDERLDFFKETANRRGLSPTIVEKDFWVCFTLRLLFETPILTNILVFKGGTSLSKIFNIIKRFSEDIDLSINPDLLGFENEKRPDAAPSRRKFLSRCKELEKSCNKAVEEQIQPILENAICKAIGSPGSNESHIIYSFDQTTKSPVLIFKYPTKESNKHSYIHPQVKLELGSLTDQYPIGKHTIKSWTAEEFPDEFKESNFQVVALNAERTFWEKATILHFEHHRPQEKKMRPRLSRDIYDLCCMAVHESGQRALKDLDLLESVVNYKNQYFRSSFANYDKAKPGTFRLVPKSHRLPDLKSDYQQMKEMFYEDPPNFEDLLMQLKKIENAINLDHVEKKDN